MADHTHDNPPVDPPVDPHGDEQIEIETEEARAGTAPGIMRYVLIVSMILVIVIFAILLLARR